MKQTIQILAYQRSEKDKELILQYCQKKNLPKPKILQVLRPGPVRWKDTQLKPHIEFLESGDILIFTDIALTSKSIEDVLELIKILTGKGVAIHIIEKDLIIDKNISPAQLLDLMSDVVYKLRSILAITGQTRAREKGKLLGRPKGQGFSRLDVRREEIIQMLKASSTQKAIAIVLKVSEGTLSNWIRKHGLK